MLGALKPGFEACMATLKLVGPNEWRRRTLNRKEQLRHRAVSFRQHGFLVGIGGVQCDSKTKSTGSHWLSQFSRWRTNLRDHASVTLWKISLTETLVAVAVAYLFAVCGCNGTEFSYVIFTEQRILQRQNGETATEERQRNSGNRALR